MKSNVRLGRGLDALIRKDSSSFENASAPSGQPAVDSISRIPVHKIRANRFQPRKDFHREGLDELKNSIKENGLVQPITVRRVEGGSYELVSGERRLRAAVELGFREIPSYILDIASDTKMLELALAENLQREDLNPIEVATGYQRLIDECGLTQEQVATRVAKDRATVANFLRLLKLPIQIQKGLISGELTAGHARALLALSDQSQLFKVFNRIIKDSLSVRQVESEVRKLLGKEATGKATPRGAGRDTSDSASISDPVVLDLIDKLRRHLATRVKIVYSDDHAGEIKVQFYNDDDLERLIELILGGHRE